MVEVLRKEFADYNLTYSIGGQISFDVFPQVRCSSTSSSSSSTCDTARGIAGATIRLVAWFFEAACARWKQHSPS
jgi:hypothetical protein